MSATEHNKRCAMARVVALRELAKLYPEDFRRLRDEERRRMGLPPARESSRAVSA